MQLPPLGLAGFLLIGLVAAGAVAGIARVTVGEYARGVRWHDLRVRCHRIRRERLLMLLELQAEQDELRDRAAGIAAVGARTRSAEDDAASDGPPASGSSPVAEVPARETPTGPVGRIEPVAAPSRAAA